MFNSETLEVGIGMAFLFLTVSLICAAIQEWLEGLLKWRAMDLERALRLLLADNTGEKVNQLIQHPMLNALFPGKYDATNLRTSWFLRSSSLHMRLSQRRHLPSYIPAKHFSVAFLDFVGRGRTETGGASNILDTVPLSIDKLRTNAVNLPASLRRIVLYALDYSGGDIERVKDNIEHWFNGVMDRTSGWYKRRTQAMLFTTGLLVAVLLNIDAFHIVQKLTVDKAFREVVVKEAETVHAAGSPGNAGMPSERIESARKSLETTRMPIGWHVVPGTEKSEKSESAKASMWPLPQVVPNQLFELTSTRGLIFWDWTFPAAGWLTTAFAVMLGAPFWFDVLNRFMVIRATVKPHEKSPEESSEDNKNRSEQLPTRGKAAGTTDPHNTSGTSNPLEDHIVDTSANIYVQQWRADYKNPFGEITI